MRKILFICLTICCVSIFSFAQKSPFDNFNKAVEEEKSGFNGNKSNLSTIFNQDRIELGGNFEPELWKYIGDNVEKHYWIGFFLQSNSYLHGSQALPLLAFKVWQNGIELTRNKSDKKSLDRRFTLLILSAILADKLNRADLAVTYKTEADSLGDSQLDRAANFPAMDEFDRCIYKNIGKATDVCRKESKESEISKNIIISAGIVNSHAIFQPKPEYPEEARKNNISGKVSIKVLIDIDGSVISAEAVSGPAELFKSSQEAALKARFSPTKLSGKLVKVSGIIVYIFVK